MENLDEMDRQIVAALVRNGRASWRNIADVIGQQERTVARRGNKLLEAGIVQTNAVVNPYASGLNSIFLLTLTAEPRSVRKAATWLAERGETIWVATLSRANECTAELLLPVNKLSHFLYEELGSLDGIQHFTMAPLLDYFRSVSGWRPAVLTNEQYAALHPEEDSGLASLRVGTQLEPLDQTNNELARMLSRNGRASADELASVLSISKATVRRRLDSMISSGALFIRAIVDPAALGFPIEAVIMISCHGRSDRAGRRLASRPETRWASASDQHLLAQVAVRSMGELRELTEAIRADDDVAAVRSSVIAEVFKRSTFVYRDKIPPVAHLEAAG
ncbi:Lrp/AsnC family transcriptional regulator [Arthrobacter globiformis]|uniref:Lrp/AsnC family transcriptional regulator n=1 Tax=Arthrobacter globiformis TaxID=1665 RepID=UPI00278EBA60|nr:Lrp/AsnC family transcriptional regulator [Arthrobacter globiformis]MDQ0616713.1 DNA-binding Lrp family transcriptional regulator [Arthrobacter globiformis]